MSNKNLAFIVMIMAFMAEYFHTLFKGLVHSYYEKFGEERALGWDSVVYHFFNESFTLIIIIILRIKLGTTRAAKTITSGLIVWFLIEWIEMFLYLFKISDARLYVNDGSWLQLSTCLTIALLVYYGSIRLLFLAVFLLVYQFLNTIMKVMSKRKKLKK